LGGFELGYGSDLDVVFLHSGESESLETTGAKPIPLGVFFARLAQRMMHILGAMTPSGVLFEVDTRLRPDGAAGMLVSSLKSFAAYQQNKAWTWEHQALVRARVVAGDPAIAEQFEQIRAEILSQPRDVKELRLAVIDMRHKMLETMDKAKADQFDLKHSQGGIVDIEFMVQYGVLAFSHEHAELLRWTDNIRLLEVLANTAVMKKQDAAFLNEAYQSYRNRLHRIKLQESSAIVPAHEFEQQRAGVLRIWASWLLGKN
jgi:glutamate-ammonia-ligase adenylyltransferase